MKPLYWVIGIIVLAVVAFGGYKIWNHYKRLAMTTPATAITANTGAVTPQVQSGTNANSGLPNKTDTSNQQLNQDLQNIQNSMNQLQQDQSAANQAISNQSQDTPQQ